MPSTTRRIVAALVRSAAVAALVRSAAVAAIAVSAVALDGPVRGAGQAQAQSFTGAFLAARFAEMRRDHDAAARYWRRALSHEPQNPGLMERAVIWSVLAGEMRAVTRIAGRLHAAAPQSRDARLVLIAEAFRTGRADDAAALMADDPRLVMTPLLRDLLRGWAAAATGDAEGANAFFVGGELDDLRAVYGAYHAGLFAAIDGDHAAAVGHYQAAQEAAGRWTPRLGHAAAVSMVALGDVAAAQALVDGMLADAPDDARLRALSRAVASGEPMAPIAGSVVDGAAEAFHGLASAIGGDRPEIAQMALFYAQTALTLRPDLTETQLLAGDLLARLDRNGEAAEMFARVPADDPSARLAALGQAQALSEDGRPGEALATLRSIAGGPDAGPSVFFTLGRLLSRVEAWDDCAVAYEDGIALLGAEEERDWFAHFGAGICHERAGRWDAAEARFVRALELRPDQPDVLNYLGYSLVEQNRRMDEALEMIRTAVEARPNSGHIVDSLGWALYRLGDFDGAVDALERAVALEPNISVINDHLGDALWMVGRRMEARFQWRRALSFETESPEAEARIVRKLDVGLDQVLEDEAADAVEAGESLDQGSAPELPARDGDDETRLPAVWTWSSAG